ncbi:unnamed protein product [Arabidopsis lyrata]|nr:unnamed protein product [Arabidopsis lyrata]
MTSLQTTILVLGEGGSGAVYKGILDSGEESCEKIVNEIRTRRQ